VQRFDNDYVRQRALFQLHDILEEYMNETVSPAVEHCSDTSLDLDIGAGWACPWCFGRWTQTSW
jgi:hypothetical protein